MCRTLLSPTVTWRTSSILFSTLSAEILKFQWIITSRPINGPPSSMFQTICGKSYVATKAGLAVSLHHKGGNSWFILTRRCGRCAVALMTKTPSKFKT